MNTCRRLVETLQPAGNRGITPPVNNVLFFGGLAAVAGATVWYFVARPRAPERPAAAWNFLLTPSPSGLLFGVRGTL